MASIFAATITLPLPAFYDCWNW